MNREPLAVCMAGCVTICAALAGCGSVLTEDVWVENHGASTLAAMHDKPAPPLYLENWVNTDGVTLEELRGNVVLLDFWGVWCPPCRKLTPHMIALHEQYADQGFVIIGVHTTFSAEKAPAYIEDHEIPYIIGFDINGETVDTYNVDGFPDLYLIDRQGMLRYADIDQGVEGNLERAIQLLLAEG